MMEDLLRRLAAFEPGELPVITAYLDVRPEATGERPGHREGPVLLRQRLHTLERQFLPRGAALDSFRADAERMLAFVANDLRPATEGLAIFACHGAGLWEVMEAGLPFETQVQTSPVPQLFELIRLVDRNETAVVAIADSNTLRLFTVRLGWFREAGDVDEDPASFQKRSLGGWSQKRYQRHIDKHRNDFGDEAGTAIEALVEITGATRLLLAGDQVALPVLHRALPQRLLDLIVADDLPGIDKRSTTDDIRETVDGFIERAESAQEHDVVGRLADAIGEEIGVAGPDAVRTALERAQADILVVGGSLDAEVRNELLRAALQTGATVETIAEDERLDAMGGVGAVLRYRVAGG